MGLFGFNISIRTNSPSKTETSARHDTSTPQDDTVSAAYCFEHAAVPFHHLCKQMSGMRSLQNCRYAFMWVRQREQAGTFHLPQRKYLNLVLILFLLLPVLKAFLLSFTPCFNFHAIFLDCLQTNTIQHDKNSPFYLLHDRDIVLPNEGKLKAKISPGIQDADQFQRLGNLKSSLIKAYKEVRLDNKRAQQKNKADYNKKAEERKFEIND